MQSSDPPAQRRFVPPPDRAGNAVTRRYPTKSRRPFSWTLSAIAVLFVFSSLLSACSNPVAGTAANASSNGASAPAPRTSWKSGTLPSSALWTSVAAGNGTFVALSTGAQAAYSTDGGQTWASTTLPAGPEWWAVAYGGGTCVAITTAGTEAAYSSDGKSWTSAALPAALSWRSVAYGNGSFVAVPNSTDTEAATTQAAYSP